MFSLNLLNSGIQNIVITVKGFEPANCGVEDQNVTTVPARTHVRDFKLTPIHASVIYQIT